MNTRVKIFSRTPSLIGIFFIYTIFIQIVPGLILVSILNFPMSYGLESSIDYEIIDFTAWYTLISISILFLLVYIGSYYVNYQFDYKKLRFSRDYALILYLSSVIVALVKILSVDQIPLILALGGDLVQAAEQKARILKGETGTGGFLFGYIYSYFHYVALTYLYYSYRKKIISISFLISYIVLISFYCVYDLQKYSLAFLFLYLFALKTSIDGVDVKKLIIVFIASMCVLYLSFLTLHGGSFVDIVESIGSRIFIGQIEGSYMIYQSLYPDIERLRYGVPFGNFFNKQIVIDPAAEIINIFFPTVGDAWVNSNTYVLAHAWSIFGFISIVIAPVIVSLSFFIIAVLNKIFINNHGSFVVCIYASMLMTMRINNDFSYFMYGKYIVGFVVLLIFCGSLHGLKFFLNGRFK